MSENAKLVELAWHMAGQKAGFTVEQWNAEAELFFYPYLRRKSAVRKQKSLFRTELVNLAKIIEHEEYIELLLWLTKMFHDVIRQDTEAAFNFLKANLNLLESAETRSMSFYKQFTPLTKNHIIEDRIYQNFDSMDLVLEGAFKPFLQIAYGFAVKKVSGKFPDDVEAMDFGALVSGWPTALTNSAKLALEDPEYKIRVSQWRNIAAHKNFAMRSSRTLQVDYGRHPNRRSQNMTYAGLNRVLRWCVRIHTTIRLSCVIIYLEYMDELVKLGMKVDSMRMDQWMLNLCHDLGTHGFRCQPYDKPQHTFILKLCDVQYRSESDLLRYIPSLLLSLSAGVGADMRYRTRVENVSVEISDIKGQLVTSSSK